MNAAGSSENPFLIQGPAVISFSGGRTSAYMLWRILQAHGGSLPDDVVVCFANTGREMPATLDFVQQCASRWGVCVHWLEYARVDGKPGYIEVSHNSASRNGEPLEAVFRARSALSNPMQRTCTIEAKLLTQKRFLRDRGWRHWTSAVGLRADEMERVERATDPERNKGQWVNVCPLATAGVEQMDVFRFWKAQPFDLHLAGVWEGNCDGCFLKSRAALERMFKDHPKRMEWWPVQEATEYGRPTGRHFRNDRQDYASMAKTVRDQGFLPFDRDEATIGCVDAMCGV